MAFNFPTQPTLRQLYVGASGTTYEWDGQKWREGGYSDPALDEARRREASYPRASKPYTLNPRV